MSRWLVAAPAAAAGAAATAAVSSDGAFTAAFANVAIVGGAAKEKDALSCAEVN